MLSKTTSDLRVAIYQQPASEYALNAPFDPPQIFPETPVKTAVDPTNKAYLAVREIFRLLEYDLENTDTPAWNPLGWLIKPGNTVFLKPNMIAERHYYKPEDWNYVITHGSIIRAVVDYVFVALQGTGKIIVGDSPSTEADFDEIIRRQGLPEIKSLYAREKDFTIEIVDLRDVRWIERDRVVLSEIRLDGDPRGKAVFDLGENSFFSELDGKGRRYYGAFYDADETNRHHSGGRHEYSISKSPLVADVFINLPKLKTHKKCGLTVNLKSLVGINAEKNWLPHYAFGSPESGGDQFPQMNSKTELENAVVGKAKKILLRQNRFAQFVARRGKKLAYKLFGGTEEIVRSGNWHGNDTVWRMCLDLNRILLYGKQDGTWRETAKPFFSIVDGIIAMEGNGPVAGTPKPCGIVIAGPNPVAVDYACAKLMGFDFQKIPLVQRAFDQHRLPLIGDAKDNIKVLSNDERWQKRLEDWKLEDGLKFKPHFGWIGFVEMLDGEAQ